MRQKANHRELQFENDMVKVWKMVVSPNEPLPVSQPTQESLFISLSGGTVQKELASGEKEAITLEPHKAYSLESGLINGVSKNFNTSSAPLELMIVEMKGPKDTPWPAIPID